MNVHDILYILFKHKWKVLFCSVIGFAAAAAVYLLQPPVYESQAKMLLRYVVDRSAIDPEGSTSSVGKPMETVVNAEMEILTSWDLALEVAEAVGVQRLLPQSNGNGTVGSAASVVMRGLKVTAGRGSNVILAAYKHKDPEVATRVLNELLNRYFVKHLTVHRSLGALEFVQQQTDEVRSRLKQTEHDLKVIKAQAEVASLADSTAALSKNVAATFDSLQATEEERAEQEARVAAVEKWLSQEKDKEANKDKNAVDVPRTDDIQRYQALMVKIGQMRVGELDLLTKFTAESEAVRLHKAQINDLENQRRELEKRFPALVATNNGAQIQQPDLFAERAKLAGLEAKIVRLEARLKVQKGRSQKLADLTPQINELERKKELEEANYKYFGASLERARVDELLDPSKIPNISVVQRPTNAMRTISDLKKILVGLAGGGVALGLGLAGLIELVFNRTVKRPIELENKLRVPLLLSIPYLSSKDRVRLKYRNGSSAKRDPKALASSVSGPPAVRRSASAAPWDLGHFIRSYSEAIRDRLGLYFEVNNLNHKPKLVAVTGFREGSGVSTLAGGLAAAFSETGDGKVLLVDMNVSHAEVHPFFKGKPASSLAAALQPAAPIASAAENLYLATVAPQNGSVSVPLGLKRFYDMMPNFKASDFDYIIFDMPPLNQTSPTLGMLNFMDKVLLVVEAEKCHADVVQRGYGELMAARADVSVVFNKARSYAPKWIEGER